MLQSEGQSHVLIIHEQVTNIVIISIRDIYWFTIGTRDYSI